MPKKTMLEDLFSQTVFGHYSKSFYGAVKSLNPSITFQEPQSGMLDCINATDYIRLPKLYERLFAWINNKNSCPTSTDSPPLEVVLIGVGNEIDNEKTRCSPQVIEVIVALTALKNHKVNLTLVDRNKKSLEIAANLNEFDCKFYFNNNSKNFYSPLKECFENVCFSNGKSSYKINKNKLRHIKINTLHADILKLNFPLKYVDMMICTHTLTYIRQDKRRDVLSNMINTLRHQGKMITNHDFSCYRPVFYLVPTLPETSACEKNIIYLQLIEKTKLKYCFFSESANKIIYGSFNANLCKNLFEYVSKENPQDFPGGAENLILKTISYKNHNVLLDEPFFSTPIKIEKIVFCFLQRL